jgi:hypothetical protein
VICFLASLQLCGSVASAPPVVDDDRVLPQVRVFGRGLAVEARNDVVRWNLTLRKARRHENSNTILRYNSLGQLNEGESSKSNPRIMLDITRTVGTSTEIT